MKNYVEYGGTMTVPPPVVCKGATLYSFIVKADLPKLTALCDRVFAAPSGNAVTCTPLDPFAFLIFGTIDWVGTDAIVSGVKERNVLIHVPVEISSGGLPPTPAMFTPFIWVDNPMSLAGGRETFGYTKSYGKIQLPTATSPSYALKTFGGNDTQQIWNFQDLITIRPQAASLLNFVNYAALIAAAGLSLKSMQMLNAWVNVGTTQVFLKQFRAIEDGTLACLQQIATAKYNVVQLDDEQILSNNFDLSIAGLDSDQIFDQLGISNQTVSGGVRLQSSFRVEKGNVLWQ